MLNLHKHLCRQWDLPPSSSTLPRGVVKNELVNQEARHDLQTIPTLKSKHKAIILRFEGDVYESDLSKSPVFLQLERTQQFPNIELIMCVDVTKSYSKIAHRQERRREAHPELAIDTPRNPNQTMLLSMEDLIEAAGQYNLQYLSVIECVKAEAHQKEFETVHAISMVDPQTESAIPLVMPIIDSPPKTTLMQEYLFPSDARQQASSDGSGRSVLPATSHPDSSSLVEETTSSTGTMFTALSQSMESSSTYATRVTTSQSTQVTNVYSFAREQAVRKKQPGESTSRSLKGFKIPKSKKMPVLKPPQVLATPPPVKESKARPTLHQFGKVAPKTKVTEKKKVSPKVEAKTTPTIKAGAAPTQASLFAALKKKRMAQGQPTLSVDEAQEATALIILLTPKKDTTKPPPDNAKTTLTESPETGEKCSPLNTAAAPSSQGSPTLEAKKGAKRTRVNPPQKKKPKTVRRPSSATPPAKKVQRPEAPSVVALFKESMAQPNPATEIEQLMSQSGRARMKLGSYKAQLMIPGEDTCPKERKEFMEIWKTMLEAEVGDDDELLVDELQEADE